MPTFHVESVLSLLFIYSFIYFSFKRAWGNEVKCCVDTWYSFLRYNVYIIVLLQGWFTAIKHTQNSHRFVCTKIFRALTLHKMKCYLLREKRYTRRRDNSVKFLSPLIIAQKEGNSLLRDNIFFFQRNWTRFFKALSIRRGKQEVTKFISSSKNGGKIYQVCHLQWMLVQHDWK